MDCVSKEHEIYEPDMRLVRLGKVAERFSLWLMKYDSASREGTRHGGVGRKKRWMGYRSKYDSDKIYNTATTEETWLCITFGHVL